MEVPNCKTTLQQSERVETGNLEKPQQQLGPGPVERGVKWLWPVKCHSAQNGQAASTLKAERRRRLGRDTASIRHGTWHVLMQPKDPPKRCVSSDLMPEIRRPFSVCSSSAIPLTLAISVTFIIMWDLRVASFRQIACQPVAECQSFNSGLCFRWMFKKSQFSMLWWQSRTWS